MDNEILFAMRRLRFFIEEEMEREKLKEEI
jgi:hypothetical protein